MTAIYKKLISPSSLITKVKNAFLSDSNGTRALRGCCTSAPKDDQRADGAIATDARRRNVVRRRRRVDASERVGDAAQDEPGPDVDVETVWRRFRDSRRIEAELVVGAGDDQAETEQLEELKVGLRTEDLVVICQPN